MAKYKDTIGFIKAEFTTSLKERIKNMYPNIKNITIKNIGYLEKDAPIYDNNNNNSIENVDAYQSVRILEEINDYYLVDYEGTIGLIKKDAIKTYNGTFIIVDLSDQEIYLYCNNDMVFKSYCTTGSDETPTRVGAFSVYERSNSRNFSKQARAKYIWANFDHGNGIHDAPWESQSKFGSDKYRKKNGSKGCVRLPDETAIYLRKYIRKGTKVLVKK